jgi:hypothetical protein
MSESVTSKIGPNTSEIAKIAGNENEAIDKRQITIPMMTVK